VPIFRRRDGDSVWPIDTEAKTKTLLAHLKEFAAKAHIDFTMAVLRKTSVRLSPEKPKVEANVANKTYRYDPSSRRDETVNVTSISPNSGPTASKARHIRKQHPTSDLKSILHYNPSGLCTLISDP
jgi:hypothetical protein